MIWPHIVSLKYLSYLSCDLSYPLLYFICVIMVSRYIYKCPLLPDSRLFTWAGYPANRIYGSYSILANKQTWRGWVYNRSMQKQVQVTCSWCRVRVYNCTPQPLLYTCAPRRIKSLSSESRHTILIFINLHVLCSDH